MKKILLLEDNYFDADLVSRELKKQWPDVELKVANTIAEARALIKDDSVFDIAIFDLKLPDGNGMELLTELRNKDIQTPIIIYTNNGSEEVVATALKLGANDYISKKIGYEKLLPEQIEFTLNQSLKYKKILNVLYIEHHKADVELTNHYFKKHAPHIYITNVSDGDIALGILPKNRSLPCEYDLILLDYKLPGLNALEIIKIIRQERKLFIPIVIVTGQGDETIAAKALKIGADDYVVKKEHYLLHLPSVIMSSYQHRELERQQHALKQSELKFRLLANYSSEWEYWVDQNREYIYNSPICEQTTGYKHQDFVNNKDLLRNIVLPEHHTLVDKHFCKNSIDLQEPIEFKIKALDGSIKWISHFCRPVYDDDKNYLGQRGVNRDITAKKRAEQVQNIILNISNASQTEMDLGELMVVIQNELGRIVDTKNFFVAFYNEVNDSLHIPYYKDIGGDDVVDFPASESISGIVIRKGVSLLLDESEMIKLEFEKTGMIGPNSKSWLGVPLKTLGKITGVFVVQSYEEENAYSEKDKEVLEIISNQISISIERKRYEDELIRALEKAKESDRLKTAFLANMSHEIRTPMSGILGFSELLKTPELSNDKQQKYIDIIEKSGKRMLTTINDIMDVSKIEAGLMDIQLSEFNINERSNEIFDFFKAEAEKKGIELSFSYKLNSVDANIKTDRTKIYSILTNLIKNAIKFTNNGSVEFGFQLKENLIVFFVKDTGIGIPKDRQNFVFDRFIQADIEDKLAHEGSGLGLAISKSYVEMLGGTIWLISEEEIGSEFYFTIPYQRSI